MNKLEIFKNIFVYDKALYFKSLELLVIADLQIGQENYFASKGFFLPKHQTKIILEELLNIIKELKPKRLLINGDFKHDFTRNSKEEFSELSHFIETIQKEIKTIIIVKGNHDTFLPQIVAKYKLRLVEDLLIEDVLFTHGHKALPDKKFKIVVMGHEQPAVVLRQGFEKFKLPCFVYGKTLDKKNIIVMPSFSPLSAGTEINLIDKRHLLSPILRNDVDIDKLKIIAIDKELGLLKLPEISKLKIFDSNLD